MKKLIVVLVLLIASNSYAAKKDKYTKKMETWLGHSSKELVDSWGYPNQSTNSPDGKLVLIYTYNSQYQMPTYQLPTVTFNQGYSYNRGNNYAGNSIVNHGAVMNGQVVEVYCYTYFTVTNQNIIESFSWKGNACK